MLNHPKEKEKAARRERPRARGDQKEISGLEATLQPQQDARHKVEAEQLLVVVWQLVVKSSDNAPWELKETCIFEHILAVCQALKHQATYPQIDHLTKVKNAVESIRQ